MEKIFDVLRCVDNHKVKLATYKLEGDVGWWKQSSKLKAAMLLLMHFYGPSFDKNFINNTFLELIAREARV